MNMSTNNTVQPMTPKQQQNPSDVKRWASVVKAKKKIQFSSESDNFGEQPNQEVKITQDFDCVFKTLPKCYKNHKGYIRFNNDLFSCTVCSLELDSVLSLSNHLKTRKHEDNVINYLKEKLPAHLHHTMEFVSFNGSNLCCNLCRCKIDMSSQNAYETIVNIVAHNYDVGHASQETHYDTHLESQETYAHSLLKTLVNTNSEIKKNLHFIDMQMKPQFNCTLCNKNILYVENVEILEQNFVSHLKSSGHNKNQKSVDVLKQFREASVGGKQDNFILINGNITCTYCNHQVEAELDQLLSHPNGIEHEQDLITKLEVTPSLNGFSDNLINEAKYSALQSNRDEIAENEKPQQGTEQNLRSPSSLIDALLSTMPLDLKNIDYLIENDKGSVTCLICNCIVPPSTYNVKTHVLGNNHIKNQLLKKALKYEEVNKDLPYFITKKHDDKDRSINNNIKPLSTISNPLAGGLENLSHIVKTSKGVMACLMCQCRSTPVSDNFYESRVLEKIPKDLKAHKCNQVEKIPSSVLNYLYNLLLNTNSLVSKNINDLVKNVDGKHSYCKLCRSLIPLSLDLNDLENHIVLHLKENRHQRNVLEKRKKCFTDYKDNFIDNDKESVVNSLFVFPKDNKKYDSVHLSNVDSRDLIHNPCLETAKENRQLSKECGENSEVFGNEEDNNDSDGFENSKMLSLARTQMRLPVTKTSDLNLNLETDEEVLNRRQKQIDYGKNTQGYIVFCKVVPRYKRSLHHPRTPPKHLQCSRRAWDGLVRVWRKKLHAWDPPSDTATTTLFSDIKPLTD